MNRKKGEEREWDERRVGGFLECSDDAVAVAAIAEKHTTNLCFCVYHMQFRR